MNIIEALLIDNILFYVLGCREDCAKHKYFIKFEFIKEDMDETVFMFALFKCRKFDKRRN